MTSLNSCLVTAGLAVVVVFFLTDLVYAQWLQLGERQGSLESVTEYLREDSRGQGSPSTGFSSLLQRESFTLRNTGAIVDPRLVNFSFGGTYGYSNSWATDDNQKGSILGYDFSANILPQKPFSLNLFANRSQNLYTREQPGVTQILTENFGGTLFADSLFIPSNVRYRRESRDEESSGSALGVGNSQKNLRNVLTYEGLRGWLNSEMELRYELSDDQNLSNRKLDSRRQDAALNYSLDFGPELNRRWDSRVHFLAQSGFSDLTTLSVNEWLRIEHREDFQTNYRYGFTNTTTQEGSVLTHDVAAGLEHRLYRNLTTHYEMENSYQTLPGGWKEMLRNNLDFTYTKRLPMDGQLNAALGAGLAYETDRFSGSESFAPQESHSAASPFALPIALNSPFVNLASVVVTKIAAGPLPIGCIPPPPPPIPLVLGQDYVLQASGNFTEIKPVPCVGSTTGINPGDTIAVDYRFAVPSKLAFTTTNWHANFSFDYGWMRPYFTHVQTNQSLVSGGDSRFLNDQRSDNLGVEFRYDNQRMHSRWLAEGQAFASTRMKYRAVRFNQILGVSLRRDVVLTFSADEALTAFSQPRRNTFNALGTATLSYFPTPDIVADLFVVNRMLNDNTSDDERARQAGVRLRWYFRKVELLPAFEIFDTRRGDTRTMDFRWSLRLIRRF